MALSSEDIQKISVAPVPTAGFGLSLDLSGRLPASLGVPFMTVGTFSDGPPQNPRDNDIWVAESVDSNGTRWQFQYNASSSASYKWEFIGGPPTYLSRFTAGDNITADSSFHADTTLGTITLSRAGIYTICANAYGTTSTSGLQEIQLSYTDNGSSGAGLGLGAFSASTNFTLSFNYVVNWSATHTLGLSALSTGTGTFTLKNRGVFVAPVRVS